MTKVQAVLDVATGAEPTAASALLERPGNHWGSDPVMRKKLPRNPDPLTHRA